MMKVLAVRQPWASCLIAGIKPVENRSRSTPYRGDVAILACKNVDRSERALEAFGKLCRTRALDGNIADLPRRCIIGVIDLHDVTKSMDDWWFDGPNGWLMRNPRPLRTNIPANGTQLLVSAPEELERRIRMAL